MKDVRLEETCDRARKAGKRTEIACLRGLYTRQAC